ncbi:MAG: MerR family transcriptional regulator [Clostridia bacterium]
MKISEFANRFDISVITVRYYVSCGLLLPEVHNKQYRFDERCVKDMEMILQLKCFDFSITEIQQILALTRLSNLTAADDMADLIRILEQKDIKLKEKLLQSQQNIRALERYINSMKQEQREMQTQPVIQGVPIEMLSLVCCPDCQTSLSLLGADIRNGQVIRAELACTCGYQAVIQDGILITRGGTISELDSPDIDRKFYKDLPVSWVTLFQRSFNWMFAQYAGMDLKGRIVMENHINCYFFLFARLSEIDPDAYYIFTDKYPEIVALFKELIERQNLNLKILYIADSTFRYPLKKECVDVYVDYHSLNEYSIFNRDQDIFHTMLPYLRHGAEVLGTYFYFASNSPSRRELIKEYPDCAPANFSFSHFKNIACACNLVCQQEEEIGSVSDWGGQNRNFTYHVKDDPMHLHAYRYKLR